MDNWKSSSTAATAALMHILLVMGCPTDLTGPDIPPATPSHAVPTPVAVRDLADLDARLNDLMIALRQAPESVELMAKVADLYAEQGWYEQAIGPLARALQVEPRRRGLWVRLDGILEKAGVTAISDAELEERATRFVEAIEMWGHGC